MYEINLYRTVEPDHSHRIAICHLNGRTHRWILEYPSRKVRHKIIPDQIGSYAYKIFRKILGQDLIISYRTVFLKILSDSDRKMSAKNLRSFEHHESYKIVQSVNNHYAPLYFSQFNMISATILYQIKARRTMHLLVLKSEDFENCFRLKKSAENLFEKFRKIFLNLFFQIQEKHPIYNTTKSLHYFHYFARLTIYLSVAGCKLVVVDYILRRTGQSKE